ncbi:MAG: permease-like cell division protein FtsX [bacterium]
MKIRSFNYHIKEGCRSVIKNGLMSIASIASVSACAFMLIISLAIAINIDIALETLEENIGISLYLGDAVTDEEAMHILEELKNISDIRTVEYMTKQDALDWAISEWGNDSGILEGLEKDNPFPRSFEISIENAQNQAIVIDLVTELQLNFEKEMVASRQVSQEQMESVIQNPLTEDIQVEDIIDSEGLEFEETPKEEEIEIEIGGRNYEFIGIENIRHSQTETELLLAINSTIRLSTLVLLVVFSFISVGIIINTIKLTVYIRKTEISIMKYIGATDWFIRWPFVVEGIIIGLAGSCISTIICSIGYTEVVNYMIEKIPTIVNYLHFKDTLSLFLLIGPFAIVLGVVLGVIGSVSSLKKYLDV